MKRQTWITARTTPWPDGERCVEIATDVDHLDPSLFWEERGSEYDKLTDEYDDPREAVEAALRMRDLWAAETGEVVLVGLSNPFYSVAHSEKTDEEMRAWGEKAYEQIPRCAHCGNTCFDQYADDVTGETFHACNEYHAECYMYEQYGDYELDDTTEEATA